MDKEIENKLELAMAVYSALPDDLKERLEEYVKCVLYFKEMSDYMNKLSPENVEETETFATINKHLRVIIRELKNLEDE